MLGAKGTLSVHVLEAKDLLGGHPCDPMVRVSFEGVEVKTPALKKTASPAWKIDPFTFGVRSRGSVLHLSVWDVKKLKSDRFLGEVYVTLSQLGDEGAKITEFFDLLPRSSSDEITGQLRLSLRFEPSEEEATKLATTAERKAYRGLLALLEEEGLPLLRALADKDVCFGSDCDRVARYLFGIMPAITRSMGWVGALVEEEVKAAPLSDPNCLFRLNSLVTKVLRDVSRAFGTEYLEFVLRGPVEQIQADPIKYELDPSRLPPGLTEEEAARTLETNAANVQAVCTTIIDKLQATVSTRCPGELRYICSVIYTSVDDKFKDVVTQVNEDDWVEVSTPSGEGSVRHPSGDIKPEEEAEEDNSIGLTAVSGFFFLRFVSPALATPGVLTPLGSNSRELQRSLVTVCKVLQNAATGVQFGVKEHYMVRMNEYVAEAHTKVNTILRQLAFSSVRGELTPCGMRRWSSDPNMIVDGSKAAGASKAKHSSLENEKAAPTADELASIAELPGNSWCCDCFAKLSGPAWASLAFGAVVCEACAAVHKASVPSSRMVNLIAEKVHPEDLLLVLTTGNLAVNGVLEGNAARAKKYKPVDESLSEMRGAYVAKKYNKRSFLASGAPSNERLFKLAQEGGPPLEIIHLILQGASVDKPGDKEGRSPLHAAAAGGHVSATHVLVAHGAVVDGRAGATGCTPLHEAAANNRIGTVKVLLKAGASICVADAKDRSPLACARAAGATECAALIHELQFELDSVTFCLRQKDLIGLREFLSAHEGEICTAVGNDKLRQALHDVTSQLKAVFADNGSLKAQHRVDIVEGEESLEDIRKRFKELQAARGGGGGGGGLVKSVLKKRMKGDS